MNQLIVDAFIVLIEANGHMLKRDSSGNIEFVLDGGQSLMQCGACNGRFDPTLGHGSSGLLRNCETLQAMRR